MVVEIALIYVNGLSDLGSRDRLRPFLIEERQCRNEDPFACPEPYHRACTRNWKMRMRAAYGSFLLAAFSVGNAFRMSRTAFGPNSVAR